MTRRLAVLVIYSYQVSMFKRYHFSMEGTYTKEVPFLSKMGHVYKRVSGWTSGQSLPVYFIEYPPVKQSFYDFSGP